MTRETKVGLMMVALLVGVFGFLLYKRIHRPLEGIASQESNTLQATDLELPEKRNDFMESDNDPDSETFSRTKGKKYDRTTPVKSRSDDEFFSTIAEADVSLAKSAGIQKKLKPSSYTTNDIHLKKSIAQQTANKAIPRELPDESVDDTFGAIEQPQSEPSRRIVQLAEATDSDPFADDLIESNSEDEEAPMTESGDRIRPLPAPAAIDDESELNGLDLEPTFSQPVVPLKQPRRIEVPSSPDNAVGQRYSEPKLNRAGRPATVQQTGDFENGLEPAPRIERRAAPVSTFEDKGFSPEKSSRSATTVGGSSYIIEPNDSFWTISRKRYGAGRYYMALARHNQSVIADPKLMKPGVTIATPDVSVLEQRYSDLIPKPAGADPAPLVSSTQSRKSADSGPNGFFVSEDGVPMYRIAGQDTLSEIAKSHLGRSSRWVQILEMNRNVLKDGNELKIGAVLRLPADASRVQVVGTPRQFR